MHIPSLIETKRNGGPLARDQIRHMVNGLVDGTIPDYQWAALAMAIYFQGMTAEETWWLTEAMRDSGTKLTFGPREGRPVVADKHSTGGIGDKTSLILAPLLACDGLLVPMISGRGLGITGGTLDKLESIPGFRTGLTREEMMSALARIGCFMAGQTVDLVPADRKLYALRDVTATVPSIPLIVASIMSKKLAEGLDRLVLDVKFGSGAFMQTREAAQQLADALCEAGRLGGVETHALLTPMEHPLGRCVGNALEVRECVDTLQGRGPEDLVRLTLDLAEKVSSSPREALAARLEDGSAREKFQDMVAAHGGDPDRLESVGRSVHAAPVIHEVKAAVGGTFPGFHAGRMGRAALALGAGRNRADDPVDFAVGFDEILPPGTAVQAGDVLCRIHARSAEAALAAEQLIAPDRSSAA